MLLKCIFTEFAKLKRYSVLWVGVAVVLCSTLLAAIQSASEGGAIPYAVFSGNVIWNNFSLAFPFFIVLLGGFLIDREYTDDTLKDLLTVPVSFGQMLLSKLIVTGILTVLFGLLSFVSAVLAGLIILRCGGFSPAALGVSLVQLVGVAFFNFLAVSPLIAGFGRKRGAFFIGVGIAFFYGFCGIFMAGNGLPDVYPITAGLGIVGYTGQTGSGGTPLTGHPLTGCAVLALMVGITLAIVALPPSYDKAMLPPKKAGRRKAKPRPHSAK